MPTDDELKQAVATALEEEREKVRTAQLNAVSIKLPQFWPDKTRFWFAQAEAQFETRNITNEKTKFNHVVLVLDSKTATQALDIIETPDPVNPYTVLKERLTKAYSLSDSERAGRLIDMAGLGDRTPSQCLADMLQLIPAGQAVDPGFLFRELFLRQLPVEIRTQLAQTSKIGTTAKILRELAEEADRYFTSTGSRISMIAETTSSTVSGQQTSETTLEADSMAPSSSAALIGPSPTHNFETSPEVLAISNRGGYNPRSSRGGTGPRGRGGRKGQGSQLTPKYTLCQYHAAYGNNARKCIQPCLFNQQGNAQPGRGRAQ